MVHLPTENVTFTVASSNPRPERARAEVAGMVRGLRVLDGRVAVPGTGALAADYGRSAEAKYVADLRDLGLEPVVRARRHHRCRPRHGHRGLPGAGHPAARAAARSP